MLSRVGIRGGLSNTLRYSISNRGIQCSATLRDPDKPQNKLDELFPRVQDFPNHHIGNILISSRASEDLSHVCTLIYRINVPV